VHIYTIGFSKRPAPEFFGVLRAVGIKRCIDVRSSNTSQLAGFTKRGDLPFFLRELCGAEYIHEPLLAPTLDLMRGYRQGRASWEDYERHFIELMAERRVEDRLDRSLFDGPTALLCVETTAAHCHRRLVVEYLKTKWGDVTAEHLWSCATM
jgi:uncharacterized protein (DUF488 family)